MSSFAAASRRWKANSRLSPQSSILQTRAPQFPLHTVRPTNDDVRFSNRPVMGWTRRALASRSRKPAWGCENQEHPMPRATSNANVIATIGIDIGKNSFNVIGLDDKGAIILRHKLSRGQVYARLETRCKRPFDLPTEVLREKRVDGRMVFPAHPRTDDPK